MRWISESGDDTGVFGHPEVVEDQTNVTGEFSHFLGDASDLFGFDDTNGKTSKSGDILGAVAGTDSASVFVVVPIQDVMAAILNRPMASIQVEKTLGIGLVCGSTGDAVSNLIRVLAGFLLEGVPFDEKGLSHVREVKVAVEFTGGPNLSDFDPSMIRGGILNEIRFSTILEP